MFFALATFQNKKTEKRRELTFVDCCTEQFHLV